MKAGRAAVCIALLLGSVLLAACSTPAGDTKDRITASDTPESARRANVRLQLASAYFADGQLTTALDEIKQAIALDPRSSEAFNLRGLIYAALGDNALAEDSFRRALQLDSRSADTMHNYGWYLCLQRRFGEADAMFAQALAQPQYGGAPRTMLAQGICQARDGQLQEAERTLQRAYALEPSNPAIGFNLSDVLYRRGEYERARFYIRRVNAVADQANAQTFWLAVRIEARSGNAQVANELGQQLRSRFPKSPEAAAFEQRRFDD
jgi:type IV pilus assembly protein PilF